MKGTENFAELARKVAAAPEELPKLAHTAGVAELGRFLVTKEPKDTEPPYSLVHGKPHSKREEQIWSAEYEKMVEEGNKLFHSSALGTNGISCDMCHPNASNTHPESYPKFQTQLKAMAMLRDMVNWCIENPMEGKKLAGDDPKMKALEAYVLHQRKGIGAAPGKH